MSHGAVSANAAVANGVLKRVFGKERSHSAQSARAMPLPWCSTYITRANMDQDQDKPWGLQGMDLSQPASQIKRAQQMQLDML